MTGLLSQVGGGSSWTFLILGGFFIVMMLITIVPQRKKQKQMKEMISSLRVGNRVKTIGGFVGKIVSVNDSDDTLVINISPDDKTPVNVTISRLGIYLNMDASPQQINTGTNVNEDSNLANKDDKPSI